MSKFQIQNTILSDNNEQKINDIINIKLRNNQI